MNPSRSRREFFLPTYVDELVTRRAQRSARTKSQVVTDAILVFHAILAGTLPPNAIAHSIRAQYGIGVNPDGN